MTDILDSKACLCWSLAFEESRHSTICHLCRDPVLGYCSWYFALPEHLLEALAIKIGSFGLYVLLNRATPFGYLKACVCMRILVRHLANWISSILKINAQTQELWWVIRRVGLIN